MLRVYAEKYLALGRRVEKAGQTLGEAQKKAAASARKKHPTAQLESTFHSLGMRMGLFNDLQAMSDLCSEIGLPVSHALIDRARTDAPQTAREFSALANAIEAELKSKLFFFVPQYRATYAYEDRLTLPAKAEFPMATGELRRAGVCYAFGEHTAAVFHAMRGAEICVRVLAKTIDVSFPSPVEQMEWQVILNGIAGRIKEIGNAPKSADRKADLEFVGSAAAQLQFFKDGWRVRASHAGQQFDDAQARDAIDHVRTLIEILVRYPCSENP